MKRSERMSCSNFTVMRADLSLRYFYRHLICFVPDATLIALPKKTNHTANGNTSKGNNFDLELFASLLYDATFKRNNLQNFSFNKSCYNF